MTLIKRKSQKPSAMNDRSEKEEGITRDRGEQRKCVPKYEHAAEEREK